MAVEHFIYRQDKRQKKSRPDQLNIQILNAGGDPGSDEFFRPRINIIFVTATAIIIDNFDANNTWRAGVDGCGDGGGRPLLPPPPPRDKQGLRGARVRVFAPSSSPQRGISVNPSRVVAVVSHVHTHTDVDTMAKGRAADS